ncbi:DUF7662 domain-containing protein [Allomesorhizobium camelthorni]|uniref:DUF7662 domain-containing protein n=1 Tax=Allomesorhizobium camelthorni TaxID=475069 RepID=A0A6G4WC33_9HYPH|nr:hypothetical protein [Mesorhizobium camelthorni]NGO51796.1 hypothetical protein [Mesorhizobium camelthorni]
MGKYTPLRSYLARQDKDRVPMSFDEIERLIGEKLPASKKYPAWWSNNPSNNPMTREWVAAGFQSEDVDVAGESVVFARVQPVVHAAPLEGFGESPQAEFERPVRRHPLFGRLKGVITLLPGVDLTEPADPELADYLDRKYGPEVRD